MNTMKNPDDLNSAGRLSIFCSVKSTREFSLPLAFDNQLAGYQKVT